MCERLEKTSETKYEHTTLVNIFQFSHCLDKLFFSIFGMAIIASFAFICAQKSLMNRQTSLLKSCLVF